MTHTAYNQYGYKSLLYIYMWMPYSFNEGNRYVHLNWGSIELEDINGKIQVKLQIRTTEGQIANEVVVRDTISPDDLYYCKKGVMYG